MSRGETKMSDEPTATITQRGLNQLVDKATALEAELAREKQRAEDAERVVWLFSHGRLRRYSKEYAVVNPWTFSVDGSWSWSTIHYLGNYNEPIIASDEIREAIDKARDELASGGGG